MHVSEMTNMCTLPSSQEIDAVNLPQLGGTQFTDVCPDVVRPFKCQMCNVKFDRASQLDYHHRSVHLGERSQVCQICEKGFFRKADLRTHLNVHLGTNLCICEICGKKFNHISNLIRHCRIHAGIRPYPCFICGKRFTQISSLERHKQIHERSKDKGDQCFSETNSVPNSKRITENISNTGKTIRRKHYCNVCGESFSFVFLLKLHETSHQSCTESLQCKSCNRSFQKIQDIKDHRCYSESSKCENRTLKRDKQDQAQSTELSVHKHVSDQIQPEEANVCATTEQAEDVVNHLLQEHQTESNNLSFVITENVGMDSVVSNLEKSVDEVQTREERMLRLVQTETGEQFYEFVINNIIEKPNAENMRQLENKFEESFCTEENFEKSKDLSREPNERYEQIQRDVIQNLVDINGDLNYTRYDVHEEEKTTSLLHYSENERFFHETPENKEYSSNTFEKDVQGVQSFLGNDPQAEFERYVEANFETLDRFSYDNNAERFFEFIEIADSGQTNASKESSMLRLLQSEGEQFLELLSDIQTKKQRSRTQTDVVDKNNTEVCVVEIEKNDVQNDVQNTDKSTNNEKREDVKPIHESKKTKMLLKKFQCTVCKKAFSTGYNYKQHVSMHFTDQQKFHCEKCGISFAWKSTLNKHIANNHNPDGPQKFACEHCSKVYNTLSQVNEHVKRDHLKQRDHICVYCGKSFFKKFDLKTHSRTHTDERPYVCRVCGKKFHHQSHIIRHERTHSGEKPYTCDVCQKSFSQAGSLRIHKQKHQQAKSDISGCHIDEDDPVASAMF